MIAIRYFVKKRNRLIENSSQETLYDAQTIPFPEENDSCANGDLQRLLSRMPNKRYVHVIQRLMIEGEELEQLTKEMSIETANL